MRQIKFRLWIPSANQWQNKENTDYTPIKTLNEESSGYIPMQFTGLLDKNGKEIYEHDIDGSDSEAPMIVVYQDGQFGLKYSLEDSYFENCIDWSKTEIIGNIYENKDKIW